MVLVAADIGAVAAYLIAIQQDITRRQIPNSVSVALLVLALIHWAAIGDVQAAGWALGAAIFIFVISFAIYLCGWFGGGDVKLLAVTILYIGATSCLPYLLSVGMAGGFLSVLVLLWAAIMSWYKKHSPGKLEFEWGKVTVPYGIAIALPAIWLILTRQLPS